MFNKTTKNNKFISSHSQINIDQPIQVLQTRIKIDRPFLVKVSIYHLSKKCDDTYKHAKMIHTYLSLVLCNNHIKEQTIGHLYHHISHYSSHKYANNHKSQCDGWCQAQDLDLCLQNTPIAIMQLKRRMRHDFPNIIMQLEDER